MSPNPPASTAADAALLKRLRVDARDAAALTTHLADRGAELAAGAHPPQPALADLAAAGRSLAHTARSTCDRILRLLDMAAADAPSHAQTGDGPALIALAGEAAAILDVQLRTAVRLHALIYSELSNRAAVAEEWHGTTRQHQAGSRLLAERARILTDAATPSALIRSSPQAHPDP